MTFIITHMTVDGLEKNIAVDSSSPCFGWQLESEEKTLQKAYRITVMDEEYCCWDSGIINSSDSFSVVYKGETLKPEHHYTWKVTVYDQNDQSVTCSDSFETAFLSPSIEAWDGAQWIGNNELPLETSILSVFRMSCTLQLNPDSAEAGFSFGGDDSRLLDRNKNHLGIQNRPGESMITVTLDISKMELGNPAYVHVYRKGYSLQDQKKPFASYAVSEKLINMQNRHDSHTLYLECEYGVADLFVDGESKECSVLPPETGNPYADMNRRLNLNPAGRGQDYICYPVVGKIGTYNPGNTAEIRAVEIKNFRKPCNVLYRGIPEENTLTDVSHGANTMLVTSFCTKKKIVKAKVHATARGIYELYLNGQKVSEDDLTPGMSQYDCHQYYQTYDVTGQLRSGENRIGAVLGEGWFSGAISFIGANWNYYGDRSSFLMKMTVEYSDGTKDIIVTDPASWKMFNDGPIRYASLFQGEKRDMRREEILQNFTSSGYSPDSWKPAEIIVTDETTACINEDSVVFLGAIEPALDYTRMEFAAQPDPNVRTVEVLTAVSMSEPRKNVYIYDMGQNMAGVEEIEIEGTEGQEISLRFAEVLYPDLEEYAGREGTMMLENIRAAMAEDHFILRKGRQVLKPSFTYHGYRYVEITGIEHPLPLSQVKGCSISSLHEVTASFRCSDPLISRLFENICWSLRDNFISIPTDCPQRNERMGWSGDLSVFSRTAVYLSQSDPFLKRHMQSMRDTQYNDRFADISPIGGGFGGILWGSAGITVPWEMYLQYGDVKILQEMYDSMKRYALHLSHQKDEKGRITEGPLGDWLGPENSKNESAYLWLCYYFYDLDILAHCAELLGYPEDREAFEKEREEVRKTFLHLYVDEETGMTVYSDEEAAMSMNSPMIPMKKEKAPERTSSGRFIMDTQTSYAVALSLGLFPKELEKTAASHLDRVCRRETTDDLGETRPPYSLMTGFIGTAWISQALSEHGYHETAWRMLKNQAYPSWLYPVCNGATTIWERLNSYTKDRGFGGNNSMNSFNHYSFGSVGTWMLAYAGGIRRDSKPGTFRIAPVPDPDRTIEWTEVSATTVNGTYHVKWTCREQGWTYELDLPAGKQTPVELPAGKDAQEMSRRIAELKGVSDIRIKDEKVCFLAQGGHYTI